MKSNVLAASAALVALLSACGGGGGGGSAGSNATVTTPTAVQVQITSANAPAVAANALDAAQNADSAGASTSLVSGVQVQGSGGINQPQMLTRIAHWASGLGAVPLAAGVLTPASANCSNGGSISVSGSVAAQGSLKAGDSLTVQANNCTQLVDGGLVTINGAMTVAVTVGTLLNGAAPPFHITLKITTSNLSLVAGSDHVTSNGDMTIDWTETSTTDTLTVSGSSLASGANAASGFRTVTWNNYSQSLTATATSVTSGLNGTVTSDNPRLGAGVRWGSPAVALGADWQARAVLDARVSTRHRLEVDYNGLLDASSLRGARKQQVGLKLVGQRTGSPWSWELALSRLSQPRSDSAPVYRNGTLFGTVSQPTLRIDDVGFALTRRF
jgi:hypothetical protein